MDNTISIIIPAYQEQHTIGITLGHIYAIFGNNIEVILVDQSTDDSTRRQISSFEQVIYARSVGNNRGSNLHQGAQLANGELLLFLHADTQLPVTAPGILRELALDIYSYGAFNRTFDRKLNPFSMWVNRFHLYRARHRGYLFGDQAMFVSRKMYKQVDGFRPWGLFEDVDLGLRLYKQAHQIGQHMKWIEDPVVTSSRKFASKGSLKTFCFMLLLTLGYHLGIHPNTLGKRYRKR